MPSPIYIVVQDKRTKILPVFWDVQFDDATSRLGSTQTIAEALAAVQLAIDGMRDEK